MCIWVTMHIAPLYTTQFVVSLWSLSMKDCSPNAISIRFSKKITKDLRKIGKLLICMIHCHMVKKKDGSLRLIHTIKFEWIAQGWSCAIIGLCHNDASATACGNISVIIIYGDLGWIMYEQQGGLCIVYQTLGQQSFIKLSQAIKNMMDLIWKTLLQREAGTHNGWFSQK